MGWYCAMKSPDGSSPLVRRTLETGKLTIDDGRFIPACAGNSKLRDPRPALKTVHPRLRGELLELLKRCYVRSGSSPLARGTQDLDRLGYVADRFIPAYAGNSWRLRYSCGLVPVHPRLRGELRPLSNHNTLIFGSSPLMRGTLPWCLEYRPEWRFIPAYAGNSIGREKRHEF